MSDEPTWWEDFFVGAWLDVHDQIKTAEATEAECDFLVDVLDLDCGDRVLDVPCGSGRHSLELASRGLVVTGVDVTEPLLARAREAARARRLDVQFLASDMRDLTFDAEFDAALCMWGSFGYFDDAENLRYVEAVSRALAPGGRFIIDTPTAECLFVRFVPRTWHEVGQEQLLLEERFYDVASGRIETAWTVVDGSGQRQIHSSIRLYTFRELKLMLESAGFDEMVGYSGLDGEEFELGSPRLHLVARKARETS